ncbi:MAG: response regulator [Planctomycetales bacterium]|nr:response regulator [Planctomycetales bacterium]
MSGHTVTVLLVEDDAIDARAIKRAFQKAKIGNPIVTVTDGLAALARLRGTDGSPPIEPPYIILLDLNMPRMNGIEFLDKLRDDSQLCNSIVFVLTTSDDDHDKVAAYAKNVAGYVVKSKAGSDFLDVIGLLDHYWRIIEFPPAGN